MHRMRLQKIVNSIKHSLRLERRLTLQECYELFSLAEEIVDFGRQVHAHHRPSAPEVILEIAELEYRLRETRRNIRSALMLLREMGRAEPARQSGYWKLEMAGPGTHEHAPAA